MSESNETPEQPTEKSRIEKIAGPAVWVGCFVIWPATSIAVSVIGYKTSVKQLELEMLKQAAREAQ